MQIGPFFVNPAQIEGLGGAEFAELVSRLLDAEISAHGLCGTSLQRTYQTNVGDGGVDAGLRSAVATKWIPHGESIWQFKAGDLAPAKCKEELRGSATALRVLKAGGSYRLVLGKTLTPVKVDNRRKALEEEVSGKGVDLSKASIEVLTADGLASWAEEFPALTVHPVISSAGSAGLTLDEWTGSAVHGTTWTSSVQRDQQLDAVRRFVSDRAEGIGLHVDGFSGMGKSRLILEALRGRGYEALVLYVPAADSFDPAWLIAMDRQSRTAVIVIDECGAKTHNTLSSVLQSETAIRLITIGEPSDRPVKSSPVLRVTGLDSDAMARLLRSNQPALWPEAVSVVVGVAAGNIDFALKAARVVVQGGATSARALVTGSDVRAFLAKELPEGSLFLGCSALALFTRVGFDGEVSDELAAIAVGLGLDESDLRAAATELESRGLISRQGRFRSVGPHPMAVYLAGTGWDHFGEAILRDLLPRLNGEMAGRLFRRAAELGDADPVQSAVRLLLGPDGPLATLDDVGRQGMGEILNHVAVLDPEQATDFLDRLFEDLSDEDLREGRHARRALVTALEKIVWRRETFEVGASLLVRLALAENEGYGNNATGTWVELFGAMLPTTAAVPATRMRYLRSVAQSVDPRTRSLAVRGAAQALQVHESVLVSGELQGGSIVEERGAPKTLGDLRDYRQGAIGILRELVDDEADDVASAALKALTDAIHPLLEDETSRRHLGVSFVTMGEEKLRAVRREIASLQALFARGDVGDHRPAAIEELLNSLPGEDQRDRLVRLLYTSPWDLLDGQWSDEAFGALEGLGEEGVATIIEALTGSDVPAAYEAGRVLARAKGGDPGFVSQLVALGLGRSVEDALAGYLRVIEESGRVDAFDSFIDGSDLPADLELRLTARGPLTTRARQRVDSLAAELPVKDAAVTLFRWLRDSSQSSVGAIVAGWMSRLDTQADYNAVIDLLALYLHRREVDDPSLMAVIEGLVVRRAEYPEVGQQRWDWGQLARRLLSTEAETIVSLLIDLVEADVISLYEGSDELKLFKEALSEAGPLAWMNVMDRIEKGAWRTSFGVRGWLAQSADLKVARDWVGDSVGRARLLAQASSLGGQELSDVPRYLLTAFEGDDGVSSALVGGFISGMWTGPESDRVKRQIEQVEGWAGNPGEDQRIVKWARRLRGSLRNHLRSVEQREAEEYW